MARHTPRGLWLAALALALTTSACSVIVSGKLDKLSDDAGPARCTPRAACDDRNPCTGPDQCSPDGYCVGGTMPVPDGLPCDSDGNAATQEICVVGACALSRCGDGVVALMAMPPEQCDDGNNVEPTDFCKNDCTFPCMRDQDCDDGNVCNGLEACTIAPTGMRKCRAALGALPAPGTACVKPDGNPGTCTVAGMMVVCT